MPFKTALGLSRKSGITHREFLAVTNKISENYRSFTVPKRSGGGTRRIVSPKPALKAVQRVLADDLQKRYPTFGFAHAYVVGRSIRSHANMHKGAKSFVRLDIEGFFPSISISDVDLILEKAGYPRPLINDLARLATLDGCLPQGAPSSPVLSNLRMSKIDDQLGLLAETHRLRYSRYADDIVLSGDACDQTIFDLAVSIIEDDGFSVNSSKSFYAIEPKKMILTGISVATGQLKVPRDYKRTLRKEAHKLLSDGTSAMFSDGKFDPFRFDRIMGRLAYWAWIEPEADFPRRYQGMLMERFKSGKVLPRPS